MENPDIIYQIPRSEISDNASFLDAVKKRILDDEKSFGIFLQGPNKGICIELVHPNFDDGNFTVHISCELYKL